MNFTIQENPTEIKPCIQQVREQIFVDKSGVYTIPTDLKIADFPEEVINSFLDYMNQFEGEIKSDILKMLKDGVITMTCTED